MEKTYTVLNVEDMPGNRDLVRRILESRNYRVVEAENGMQGITKAMQVKPDLILMDINLPDLDGFSVVTRIRSQPHLANTPIVALTARDMDDDEERARAIGCDGYLNKPFSVKELLDEVAARIGKPRLDDDDLTRREFFLREHSAALVEELERKFKELSDVHAELSVMHERLQRLDEAKTDFIHIAAHELRTPLTMVHVYTDMLRTHPALARDAALQELLDGLRKGVDRLNSLTNDMISIARVELATIDLAYSPLSIRRAIEPVVQEFAQIAEERTITLTVEIDDDLPQIMGDETQLSQVFSRLIGNAIKYTPDNGRITISARLYRAFKEAEIETGSQFIEVFVADTGIGINKQDQGLIFEKFYTVEDSTLHSSGKTKFMGGGPGLGLTIAKGIVEAHGGRIWVESEGCNPETNAGSVFYVILPAM